MTSQIKRRHPDVIPHAVVDNFNKILKLHDKSHQILSPTYKYSWAILHRDWSTPHRAVPSFHAVDRFLTSSCVSILTRGVSVYWHMLINIHDADGGRQSIAPCSWRHSWRITAVTGDSYLRIMRIYSLNSINNLLLNYLWTSKHTYEWNLVTFEPTNNRILQY